MLIDLKEAQETVADLEIENQVLKDLLHEEREQNASLTKQVEGLAAEVRRMVADRTLNVVSVDGEVA